MKAKKILLCAVSLVLLLLIVVRIVHVNTNVLTIPEERYAQNQWVELSGNKSEKPKSVGIPTVFGFCPPLLIRF